MLRILGHCFLLLALSSAGKLAALETVDGDITLLPAPPPKSQILGVTFEESPGKVLATLAGFGLQMKEKKAFDEQRQVQIFVFSGLPGDFDLSGGETTVTFLKNQLVALDFSFPPSYRNFLLIRSKIFKSLNGRFSLAKKQEFMDDMLRAHLAHLKPHQYGVDAETKVSRAMIQGSTFFHYVLQDSEGEFRSTYAFVAMGDKPESREPSLLLHFGLKKGMSDLRDYKKSLKAKESKGLLP